MQAKSRKGAVKETRTEVHVASASLSPRSGDRTTIQSFHFNINAVQNQPSMRLKTSKKQLKYRNLDI